MHAHKLRAGIIYIYSGGLDEHLLLPLSPSTLRSSVLNSIPFPADEHPLNRAFSQSGSFPLRSLYRLSLSRVFFIALLLSLFLCVSCFSLSLARTYDRTHAVVSIGHANPESKRRSRHYLVIINIDFIVAKMCNLVSNTPSYGIVSTRASPRILVILQNPRVSRIDVGICKSAEARKYSHYRDLNDKLMEFLFGTCFVFLIRGGCCEILM